MDKIQLKNIRVYSQHGCLEEEAIIGSDYQVDLTVKADLSNAVSSDRLSDTVDYVHLNRIVKEEMNKRSKLIEHVADRVLSRVFKEFSMIEKAKIRVAKINPPIGGDVAEVAVVLSRKR